MGATVRLARAEDAAGVLAIYGPVIEKTAISFELEVPSESEIRRRIEDTLARWPWLVCDDGARIAGYAYATRHRERGAYQWSADVAVYIAADQHRRGIGRALYTALLDVLVLQGYCNAYAGIALPNAGSVGLHEAMGFRHLGVYKDVGHKHGRWHDVGWWHLALRPPPESPEAPRPIGELLGTSGYAAALARGQALLRP